MLSVVTIADIAQAVADKLNAATAGTFVSAFTAERIPIVSMDLAKGEIDDIRVFVAPKPESRDVATRASVEREIRVDVAVYQRLPEGVVPTAAAANATVDPLLQLVQQFAEYPKSLSGGFACAGAGYIRTEQDAAFDRDEMNGGVFASVTTYCFKIQN
jgi:hypothetical protein